MTQKQGWKLVAAAAVALGLAFSPMAAMATDLSFTQVGGFTLGTASSSPCTQPNTICATNGVEFFGPTGFDSTYQQVGWGTGNFTSSNPGGYPSAPNNTVVPTSPVTGLPPTVGQPADFPVNFRSALDLDTFTGTVTVGGDWVDISSLQHYNRTIGGNSNSLSQITIDTLLTLDTIPPSGSDSDPGQVVLGFNETLNISNPCPGGDPATGHCEDIFTFQAATLNPVTLTVGGVTYTVEFRLLFPLTTFDERTGGTSANGASVCPALDPATNVCTAEDAISEVIVQMRILAVSVPAPASLLLLGFGLSGLGVAGWLRRK